MAKQYGLILPASKGGPKSKPVFSSTRNVFGDDSDSDENPSERMKAPLRPSENVKRKTKVVQEKAVKEDPSVYLYDELYDDMSAKKTEEKKQTKAERKPKYIEKLLETATKRKRENERRLERQVQKEREEEGEQFADKEAFVTSAYKKKLEELRLEEEKEKREDYLESIGDVTKQKDLDGFYRHIYEQRLQPEKITERLQKQSASKDADEQPAKEAVKTNSAQSNSDSDTDSEKKASKRKPDEPMSSSGGKKQRTYRRRKSSTDNKESGEVTSDDEAGDDEINKVTIEDLKAGKRLVTHMQSNLDADSDFSIDSSSSDDEDAKDKPKTVPEIASKDDDIAPSAEKEKSQIAEFAVPEPIKTEAKKDEPREKSEQRAPQEEIEEEKHKIDIWKKRTVGVVFEEALKRYYERKSSRSR